MVWTSEQFRKRHAKHLTPSQAKHAASMANAMLKGGTPEGEAIATAIKRSKRMKKPSTKTVLNP